MKNDSAYGWRGMDTLFTFRESGMFGTAFSEWPPDWKFGTRVPQWWERLLHLPIRPLSLDLSARSIGILLGTATRDTDTSLLRLATNAARHCWRVIQFDPLGSHERAATFRAAMQQAGLQNIRAFPYESYNGWGASPELLQQHLLQGMSFYRDPYQRDLAAICLAAIFAQKPVASLKELVQRLTDFPQERWSWVYQCPAPYLAKVIQEVSHKELVELAAHFGAFATLLGIGMDGTWSLRSVDAAYLSFDAVTHPLQARTQAAFLLADLASYLTDSGRQKKRVLLLLRHPELLFDLEQQLVPLLSTIDQLGGSVVLALHTPADLGPTADRILSLAHTVVMHRSPGWWPDLTSAFYIPNKYIPSAQTLAQLPHDACLVVHNGCVWHACVDPVRIAADILQHARVFLYARAALSDWEQRTSSSGSWSLFDVPWETTDVDEAIDDLMSHFRSVRESFWFGQQGWTLEVQDLLLPTGISKAFDTLSETKCWRQRGKRGSGRSKETQTRDPSSEQGNDTK